MSTVFDRMKQIMADENYPIGQFYADFGLSNSSFTDWKRSKDGYPPTSVLVKFSQRFSVSIDFLLFGNESETQKPMEIPSLCTNDKILLDKFHALPVDKQIRLMGYIDGMLDALKSN